MTRAFFTSGGSDAVETALRLARQYWKLSGSGERTKFIALRKGYHGTHFGGDSVSGGTPCGATTSRCCPVSFTSRRPTYRNPFGADDEEQLAVAAPRRWRTRSCSRGRTRSLPSLPSR